MKNKELNQIRNEDNKGRGSGLVVRAEGSRPRGRGLESRRILERCKL
jgi:hypothetical protein